MKSKNSKRLSSYNINIKIKIINKSLKLSKKQIKAVLDNCILFDISLIILIYIYYFAFYNYICYFNIGQGNMALIHYKNKNVIIDCGSTDNNVAANVMSSYMKSMAYNKIDAIFITHFHADHVNGIEKLSEKYDINKLCYMIPKFDNVSEYDKFQKNIVQRNISVCEINQYDSMEFGKDFKIDVILPSDNIVIPDSDLMNANSCIYLIQIKNKNYLFMGDATKSTEKSLVDLLNNKKNNSCISDKLIKKLKDIEVLQVGHHGSKTSTSEEFLKNINIKFGIISSKKEKYGHPDQVTLDVLKKYNIKTKVTEINGAITVKI